MIWNPNVEALNHSAFDRQAHFLFTYQADISITKALMAGGAPLVDAMTLGALASFSLNVIKAFFLNPEPNYPSLASGALGSLLGAFTVGLWPKEPSWLSLDAELGASGFYPISVDPNRPPNTGMIMAENTIWIYKAVGLHLLGGGIGIHSSDVKLIWGGGLRLSVYPFLWQRMKSESSLTAFVGADVGLLMFSLPEAVPYVNAGYVPVFSAGLKWRPIKKAIPFIEGTIRVIPYFETWVVSPGISMGLAL